MMSEKRFTYGSDVYWVKDNYKNVELLPIDVLILLNEQDKELDKYRTENAELHITILEIEKKVDEQQSTIQELERKVKKYAKIGEEQLKQIIELQEENEQLRRLFEEMKQPITINLTEEDEKELRKLLGLIDDE